MQNIKVPKKGSDQLRMVYSDVLSRSRHQSDACCGGLSEGSRCQMGTCGGGVPLRPRHQMGASVRIRFSRALRMMGRGERIVGWPGEAGTV
jgi:hypothetical protein